jgi:uncharacterized repeat protein (TIGR03803 family)
MFHQCRRSAVRISISSVAAAAVALLLALVVVMPAAQAQTLTVLHTFSGGGDGASPSAGVTMDRAGNIYGTTIYGGATGNGVVFKLSHPNWVLNTLYSFTGGNDGGNPQARVIFGPDGSLYGTTSAGNQGNGVVFNLKPQVTACKSAICPWSETALYRFLGGSDGSGPAYGDLTFDPSGNLYGTTLAGGLNTCGGACGVVFKLTRSGNSWTESVPYLFTGGNDGGSPFSGVIFDNAGNLYGTAYYGGAQFLGTAYELIPSGSGWTEKTLTDFSGGGGSPLGGLTFDPKGNLYGTGFAGGTAFELMPSGGNWIYSLLYTFNGFDGPFGSPTLDASGNVYGTNATGGAYDQGFIFKLTPSNGGWTFTDLYDFTGGNDGGFPVSNVIFDANGNLYGTTFLGGASGEGVVWQFKP